ncbi:cyclin-like protein [Gloeophyllum trabeum ATCC 11539]|uniref:B-related factor 1 n=1 Tax=Gloeophyllum trabeum (strain ATCC 11539 / FP-39264 / Madison 617) TaxID=670483 RepID=S7PXG3_GLOTA|nr:cyclin-like protein [Gloeophyllum trabeum ATCC 11539]EPQ52208.1 cyclin-like protein [Gloeophyllum trabeum ATCC 11539]
MPVCTDCGGSVIEYDAAAGNGFCVNCGTVIEENTIVSEVTFGETSNGAAMVQGSYVGLGQTRARMGGPLGNRGSTESREQTIANASKKIQSIANVLRLSEVVCLAATRLYTLAVEHKFTKGRKSLNVVAVCLYVACRQKETRNYMLIDFSDLLQVNVFELGHTYLQLVQTLNLRLPLVDPSHYISRFAALLEFGEETHRVALDAVRLVQRFDRDWMARGRRPAGICGAALLLAARMNNFRRSVAEIVQVVKIGDMTLRKRLEEFKRTGSAALTVSDFRKVWLEDEMDPPAFTKGREKEEKEKEERESGGKQKEKEKRKKKGRKKKRKRGEITDEEVEAEAETEQMNVDANDEHIHSPPIDPTLLNQGILAGTVTEPPLGTTGRAPLFLPEDLPDDPLPDPNIDPALLSPPQSTLNPNPSTLTPPPPPDPVEQQADEVLAQEVASFLLNAQGSQLSEVLEDRERQRLAQIDAGDELAGLDEAELDAFLLTEEEVKIKERVWVELNRDYLEAIAARGDQQETGQAQAKAKSKKRRKTDNKPRDASTPSGSTPAESVRNLIKKSSKYSKRINYDALKDLLDTNAVTNARSLDEKEDDMYTMDDKSDGEGMMVVEEEGGGGVGSLSREPSEKRAPVLAPEAMDEEGGDEDAEGEDDDGSEKGVEYGGWEDAYEQEI